MHKRTIYDSCIGNGQSGWLYQVGRVLRKACMVENDEDSTEESVTFLYKIAEGTCPGFNAARLAGLDPKIVAGGREIAKELEEESKFRNVLRIVFTSKNMSQIRKALESVL